MANVFMLLAASACLIRLSKETFFSGTKRVGAFLVGLLIIAILTGVDIYLTKNKQLSVEAKDEEIPQLKQEVKDLQTKLENLPGEIIKDLKTMQLNATPLVRQPPSGVQPAKPKPRVSIPPPTQPELPPVSSPSPQSGYAELSVSQQMQKSTRPDAPYKFEVVVQTTQVMPSLKMILACDQPIVDGDAHISGGMLTMMTGHGVVNSNRNLFAYFYGSATPPFGPANPLIFDLWTAAPTTCSRATTY